MTPENLSTLPIGIQAIILSKHYYGVISRSLTGLEIERYYSVLYFLYHHNGTSQQNICNNLATDKTAMVKIVDYLVKAGLIERSKNPEDRREQMISLTRKGLRAAEQTVRAFEAVDAELFRSVSKKDREVFLKVLAKFSSKVKVLPSDDLLLQFRKTNH